MCIALIGGMDRLERNYINEAEKLGIDLRVFTKSESCVASKVKNVDAIVIFTNKVSHKAKKGGDKCSKSKKHPYFHVSLMRYLHAERLSLMHKKRKGGVTVCLQLY